MAGPRPSAPARAARLPIAVGAALALADASVVTLALPEILERLDTTVEGLAAVIGVYTLILSVAVLVAVPARRWLGSAAVGALGMLLFAVASVMCGVSDGLTGLLVSRGAQAVGAGFGLVAAYELLSRGRGAAHDGPPGLAGGLGDGDAADGRRRPAGDSPPVEAADAGRSSRPAPLWVAAAIFGTAIGPALGGALTELFDWRAIFLAQAPFGLLAAAACLVPQPGADLDGPTTADASSPSDPEALMDPAGRGRPGGPRDGRPGGAPGAPARRRSRPTLDHLRAGVALALVSAALTAVVFLLVLLLVTGWDVRPLKAAVGVTLLPVAAVGGWRIPGDPWLRASAGCAFVGAGILALAALPTVGWGWVALPQVLAGVGMGMALPALAGELLPERTPGQAGGLLALRHVGITVALLALAPVIAAQLDRTIDETREQVAALVLDARLPPQEKLNSIGAALGKVTEDDPRGSLRTALDSQAPKFAENADDRAVYARLTVRADEALITAVNGAFRTAFLITGGLALLAVLLAFPAPGRHPALAIALAAAALAVAGGQILTARGQRPDPVVIADPCQDRGLPNTGGLDGFVQDAALGLLDRAACRFGSSREQLALAFGDEDLAKEYEREFDVDPREEIPALLGGAIGGGDGEPGALEELVRRLIPGG